jgi:hypothetical protein
MARQPFDRTGLFQDNDAEHFGKYAREHVRADYIIARYFLERLRWRECDRVCNFSRGAIEQLRNNDALPGDVLTITATALKMCETEEFTSYISTMYNNHMLGGFNFGETKQDSESWYSHFVLRPGGKIFTSGSWVTWYYCCLRVPALDVGMVHRLDKPKLIRSCVA